jgi:hypothetical protein
MTETERRFDALLTDFFRAAPSAVDHDDDMFDDEPDDGCTNPGGHEFVCSGTQYGGDDESYHGEGRCYCVHCGADGDA